MGFLYSCFIKKNTKELRSKLEDLGYSNGAWSSPHLDYPYLETQPNRSYGLFKGKGFYITQKDFKLCDGKPYPYIVPENTVNCETNEGLFIAVAAMNDDNDYMQWFYCEDNKEYFFCDQQTVNEYFSENDLSYNNYRKVTLDELKNIYNKL